MSPPTHKVFPHPVVLLDSEQYTYFGAVATAAGQSKVGTVRLLE